MIATEQQLREQYGVSSCFLDAFFQFMCCPHCFYKDIIHVFLLISPIRAGPL